MDSAYVRHFVSESTRAASRLLVIVLLLGVAIGGCSVVAFTAARTYKIRVTVERR